MHVSWSSMIAWRSEPPSTWMSDPNGYGPGSLSSAWPKSTDTSAREASTTSTGIPYEGGPKSGCTNARRACIARVHIPECGLTGSFETFRCQTLSAGNTSQVDGSTGTARAGAIVTAPNNAATTSTTAARVPRTSESSAARQATVEREMAHAPAERTGFLQRPSTGLLAGLVAIHLVAVLVIIAKASALGSVDADVGRAFRIATSPAVPYRTFPVEFMPLQTAADRLLAGGTVGAAVLRIAILAFVADMAAAGAMLWGWGRRAAGTYLILALPLLPLLYLRFDLVSVALAAWAYAWLRRRHEELGGASLGLAVMAKLWPIALVPVLWLRRSRRGLIAAAVVCIVVGAWWYLTGGVKGPFQVLSVRDTRGWHVESVIGSILWALHPGDAYREADAMRIGDVATWTKAALGLAVVLVEAFVWRRAAIDRRDPMGAASLVAVAALGVFAPILSMQAAAWLIPFAALALDGDHDERHTGGVAAVAIALTGVLAIVWRDHATAPVAWVPWIVLLRNLAWIDVVVSWLRVPVRERPVVEPRSAPRRRATDTAQEGLDAVLPFDVE